MKAKRILIVNWGTLGSNYAFEVAKAKGLDIFLATSPNYPDWVEKIVPRERMVFTNTYDSEKLITDVAAFIHNTKIRFDAVTTFFEMNVVQTADLAYLLDYPFISPRSARKTSGNKLLMRTACQEKGIPMPKFTVFSNEKGGFGALKKIGVPAVLKPVKSGHSFGAIFIDKLDKRVFDKLLKRAKDQLDSNADEWMHYYDLYKNDFLIEEYLGGPVLSVDGLVQDKRIMICGISEFDMSPTPLFIQEAVTIPADFKQVTKDRCFKYTKKVVEVLELDNCAFHCELRLTKKGPVLIEIAARPPGGNMTLAYKNAYDIDIIGMYLDICLGKKVNHRMKDHKNVIMHRSLFSQDWGELTRMEGVQKLKRMPYFTLYWAAKKGDFFYPSAAIQKSIAYYQIKAGSWKEINNFQSEVEKTLHYTLSKNLKAVLKFLRMKIGGI